MSTQELPDLRGLPDEAFVVALASLSKMGPARLLALTDDGPARDVWARVADGQVLARSSPRVIETMAPGPRELAEGWLRDAAGLDPARLWQRHVDAGVGVAIRSSVGYPTPFVADVEPPAILFHRGDPDVVVGARVAIVGTRDCTRYGYDIARQLGAELAAAGVSIVSGLALGIDSAAHAGALDAACAPPIGVVGSGLDVIYPRRNASLWERVTEAGVLFSEYPLGSPPTAWHFPSRNRLIAALADVVVVVESQKQGGSMHTVDEAARRATDVLAVPGPVTSKVSAGTNWLLSLGCDPCTGTEDVLSKLGLLSASRRSSRETRVPPTADGSEVLDALAWQPATFDQLAIRTGMAILDLTVVLDRLEHDGWVESRGGWYERIAKSGG